MLRYDMERINEYLEQGYLIRQKHPTLPLYVYNYSQTCQYTKAWDAITLNARALVLDEEGVVRAKGLPKFFNLEEVGYSNIPSVPFIAYKKYDGSCIQVFRYNGEIVVMSKGSFTSDHAREAQYQLEHDYLGVIDQIEEGKTYVMEVIFPMGRIVCNYGSLRELRHLATYNHETGEEEKLESIGLPLAEGEVYMGIDDIHRLQAANVNNEEGYVLRWFNGVRMKVKFEEYVRLHRIITNVTSYSIYEWLKENDRLPEELLRQVPDEFYAWIRQKEKEIRDTVAHLFRDIRWAYKDVISQMPENYTQKDFAALVTQLGKLSSPVFMYAKHGSYADNTALKEWIWKNAKPAYEKPTATSEVKE